MLVLDNEDVKKLLTFDVAAEAIAEGIRQYATGAAVEQPRMDVTTRSENGASPGSGGQYFSLTSTKGAVRQGGPVPFACASVRINADVLAYSTDGAISRRHQLPGPSGRYCGLVLLWKTDSCEPICLMPDSYVQAVRVGASNALAAKLLAREDASTYGLIGSGWQAQAQLMGLCGVRDIKQVRVWSRSKDNRERFAREWSNRLGRSIVAVDSVEAVMRGADIVGVATNTSTPIIRDPKLLEPGMHLTTIGFLEIAREVFDALDVKVTFSNRMAAAEDRRRNWFGPGDTRKLRTYWVPEGLQDELPELKRGSAWFTDPAVIDPLPWLGDLLAGRHPGRTSREQTTYFWNNYGWGLQLAALGAVVYQRALEKGVGRELPTEWFTDEQPS